MSDESTTRPASRRRRPPSGGYFRGEETRLRVITSAIRIFGNGGFDRASTREIAAQAGVTTPVLQYHFGSKVGLYTACMDLMTTSAWQRLEPYLSHVSRLLDQKANTPALIDGYCALQEALIDSFVSENEGLNVDRLLILDEHSPETRDARSLMRQRIDQPVYAAFSGIVSHVIGSPVDELRTGLHTFALAGMFLVFQLDRERIYNLLGWRPAEGGNADQLKATLRLHATAQLSQLAKLHGTWRDAVPAVRKPQRVTRRRDSQLG